MVAEAAMSKESDKGEVSEQTKKKAQRMLISITFQAVLQHVSALQSDVVLFSQALGGDEAATSQALSTTQALIGVLGLFLNQISGKLSDSYGRKMLFLLGPLVNMGTALAVVRHPKNVFVLSAGRVLRSMFITLSGSVAGAAALRDVCSGQELAIMGTRMGVAMGAAVIMGPYVESLALKAGKGSHLMPFKVLGALSCYQLISNALFMPETLPLQQRKEFSMAEIRSCLNPFGFLKVYFGKNATLKKLLTIQSFQFCMDGKVTSDLCQLWAKNNLKWTTEKIRDFIAFWGAAVFSGGAFVSPYLLKTLSPYDYSTVGNLCVGAGATVHGLAENGMCMWGGVPLLVPGVNGGSAMAIKSLATDLAAKEGYGNGEFSAFSANMRALFQAVQIVLIGRIYARCRERGLYAGVTWFWAAFVGAAIPQLIMLTMKRKDFEKQD